MASGSVKGPQVPIGASRVAIVAWAGWRRGDGNPSPDGAGGTARRWATHAVSTERNR